MLGAIIGDIAGSRFEWNNNKSKEFDLFHRSCSVTDDSIMSLAIADAVLKSSNNPSKLSEAAVRCMQKIKVVPRIWTEKVGGTRWMTNHANGLYWSPGGVFHHVDEAADDESGI